jgi:hypothetical protein
VPCPKGVSRMELFMQAVGRTTEVGKDETQPAAVPFDQVLVVKVEPERQIDGSPHTIQHL